MRIKATVWSRLGQNASFGGVGLIRAAEEHDDLIFVTADVSTLLGLGKYKNLYADRYFDVGIAEQNLVGVAAGMAFEGKKVFVSTYASFLSARALEQIRHNLGYLKANVKVVGMSSGVATGKSGISHWCIEDIAYMRAIPNMTILSPADCTEAVKMTVAAANTNNPTYIRLTGNLNVPVVYEDDYDFEIGKAIKLREGSDVSLIATGLMVHEALEAAKLLEETGISCSVINMHTIKPLDYNMLDREFREKKLIVTIEEHNVVGGLGGAVAEYKATKTVSPKQIFMGITDEYKATGTRGFILGEYNLTAEGIANTVRNEWIN